MSIRFGLGGRSAYVYVEVEAEAEGEEAEAEAEAEVEEEEGVEESCFLCVPACESICSLATNFFTWQHPRPISLPLAGELFLISLRIAFIVSGLKSADDKGRHLLS